MATISQPKHLMLGELGETLACKYLKNKGYIILERRFANTKGIRLGEIDIIVERGGVIVFVEVKTRSKRFTDDLPPEANINRQKLLKLSKIAEAYIKLKNMMHKEYRFDAVSVLYDKESKKALIKHIESIFF